MKITLLTLAALAAVLPCRAQVVDTAEVLARVRAGGRFEETKWRRGADGSLEMHYIADIGGAVDGLRFQPVLGKQLERGLESAGAMGFLALFCHGPDDLLSMTDAEFHLGALGVDTTNVGLRQYLALSPPSFEFGTGRAELLERMLAIDLLVRRGCKPAYVELQMIAKGDLPAPLRARAQRAIERLLGQVSTLERRRLSPATLKLPLVYDGCVLVDHARLPDLGWLTALAGRLGALITANMIASAGGPISEAQCNGAQALSDVVGELPFGVVHRFGNARFDHSCLMISAKADPNMPVALTWQAVGEFEHEGWQDAAVTERLVRNNPLLGGEVSVVSDRVEAAVGGGGIGKPRLAMAEKLLQGGDGYAVRAIVPKTSKLWPTLRFLDLPAAMGAELRITFGDPGVIVLMVDTRDEEDAEDWVAMGKEMLGNLREQVQDWLPPSLQDDEEFLALLRAVMNPAFSVKDSAAFAVVELRGVTPAIVQSIAEAMASSRR